MVVQATGFAIVWFSCFVACLDYDWDAEGAGIVGGCFGVFAGRIASVGVVVFCCIYWWHGRRGLVSLRAI